METIKNYLDNMFVNLPKTSEILKLKSDLLSNMEDKYNELKATGKSENEAVGIVISEFGNIDELMNELGIDQARSEDVVPMVSTNEVEEYLIAQKKSGILVGLGVFLCILAPASLILITGLVEDGIITGFSENVNNIIGLIPLLLLIATAVGIFIYSDMRLEGFKYMENGVNLTHQTKAQLQQKYNTFVPTYTLSVIIGVILCIIAPITLFVSSVFSDNASVYGVVVLLIIIAVAVYIFIYFGTIKESLSKLLSINEYSEESKIKRDENKVISAVAAVVWPLAFLIFLVTGLVYHLWSINWIIFVITGILFGMFSGVYSILKGESK